MGAFAEAGEDGSLPNTGPGAGAIGGAAQVVRSVTLDAQGRVTAATATDLSGVTGLLKLTAGITPVAATPGVDFAKGPWKTFSTVRNSAAAQTLSIPVADGENNGLIWAIGRMVSDGSEDTLTLKINGASTNVVMERFVVSASATAGANGDIGTTRTSVVQFEIIMHTAKTANSLKRAGILHLRAFDGTNVSVYECGFHYNDNSTTITTIDIDAGSATAMGTKSEVMVMEGIAG